MAKLNDLTGRQFGLWTVLKKRDKRHGEFFWLCRCACGTRRDVNGTSLKRGASTSCGCTAKDWCRTHGMVGTPTYNTWAGLIQRCTNKRCTAYPRYGGRGIQVCARWRSSFVDFLADMGAQPPGKSIDRIDNNGNYEPGNCRWATDTEQMRNRSTTEMLTYQGETLPLPEWAQRLGIKRKRLERRIRDGWPVDEALSKRRYGRWGAID